MMDWQSRIVLNPDVLVGKPIIRGTRLSVEFIVDLLAEGWGTEEILRNYPGITHSDIQACINYANANEKRSLKYDFSDLMGRLSWQGDPVAIQRTLRDEWL